MSDRRRRVLIGCTIGVIALIVVALVTSGMRGDGGRLNSSDRDGLLGLRLLLERRGATVTLVDADAIDERSAQKFDTVFVVDPRDVSKRQQVDWHNFVHAGGTLILGQPDRPRQNPEPPSNGLEPRGQCTIASLADQTQLYASGVAAHEINSDESSCFGGPTAALISAASCGTGQKVTLSSASLFDNETMGAPVDGRNTIVERPNAGVAVGIFEQGPATRVAVVIDGIDFSFGADDTTRRSKCVSDTSLAGGSFDDAPAADGPRSASTIPAGGVTTPDGQPAPAETSPGGGALPDGSTSPGGTLPDGTASPGGTIPETGQRSGGGLPSDLPTGQLPTGQLPGSGSGSGSSDGQGSSPGNDTARESRSKPPPTLFDFLSPGMLLGIAQMVAALCWYVVRRARRDAVVIDEDLPVSIRSSEIVHAAGNLRRRAGDLAGSAEQLRTRTREQLCIGLGLARTSTTEQVADLLATRGISTHEATIDLLAGDPPTSDEQLLQLAQCLSDLRITVAQLVNVGASDTHRLQPEQAN